MLHERLVAEWRRVAAAAAAVVAICAFTGLTRSLDNQIYDRAITLVQTPPSKDIVLVEIDNASFNQLGRWPWPRRVHAGLIERLAGTRPRAIVYDVLFIEPSDDDAELAAAMRKAGKAFLPSVIDRDAGPAESGLEPLAPPIQAAARATGSAELETDADGVLREACGRVAAGAKSVKQLFEIVAEEVSGGPSRAKTDCFLIPFAPSDHFLHVSFASLLEAHVPAEALRDKVVIVGINADGLGDLFAVPVGAGKLMSGMEVHANAVNALMSGRGIVPLSPWAAFVLCLLPLGILLVGYRYLNQRLGTALLVGAVLLALGASPALLAWGGIWVSPVPAIAGIIVAFMLWGWRRLSVLGSFVGDPARRSVLSDPVRSDVAG